MYLVAPERTSRIRSYRRAVAHRSSSFGSFCGRFAFIGNSVLGRLTQDFLSSGNATSELLINPCPGPARRREVLSIFLYYSWLDCVLLCTTRVKIPIAPSGLVVRRSL